VRRFRHLMLRRLLETTRFKGHEVEQRTDGNERYGVMIRNARYATAVLLYRRIGMVLSFEIRFGGIPRIVWIL
jgi:hypothetical protein